MSEYLGLSNSESIAAIIRALCSNDSSSNTLIEQFTDTCDSLESSEVDEAFSQLGREGLKFHDRPEVIELYNGVIQDKLVAASLNRYAPGHPVRVYLEENLLIRSLFSQLNKIAPITEPHRKAAEVLIGDLSNVELHYLRKENQLFPLLERHEWDGPSNNMWPIHDEIRAKLKQARTLVGEGAIETLNSCLGSLQIEMLRLMSIEEETLFPNAMELLEEQEWKQMREGDAEIGWMFAEEPVMFPPQSTGRSEAVDDNYVHPSQLTEPSELP
ncbi:MAG TPA: hypothetical protein ENK70_08745, partial [Methylophaga sp.]|nr:hypothetical protein [Methylophaga sp.]